MSAERNRHRTLSTWQLIFSQSKVNGAPYDENQMPVHKWHWPTGTYLQRRRSERSRFPMGFSRNREVGQA